ncbi:MAG: hypothetical protein Q9206_005759 [Seirophora lacunosa]
MREARVCSWPADGQPLRPLYHKQLWRLRSNHPCMPSMVLTKEDLLAHSRYIRDTLAPRLIKESNIFSGDHAVDLTPLRLALEELHKSPMTVEILSFSRIEKALQNIVGAQGGGWPPDVVRKARDLIARWEESLGPLQRVKTDLWASGGRLHGLAKPGEWLWRGHVRLQAPEAESLQTEAHAGAKIQEAPAWHPETKCDLGRAHQDGHSGFQVGDWWLNSAAACRDGIIDNPHFNITSDGDVAYAITMTEHSETAVSKDGSCSYTPHHDDRGAFELMATINGGQRSSVRVLRSWRLQSSLAPAAGIRYDGLYRVTGYGVKLSQSPGTNNDVWRYTFHLRREESQEHMEKALAHPNSDQLDDWEDFKAGLTEASGGEVTDEVMAAYGQVSWMPGAAERTARVESIDSGYFSPTPEGQADMKGEDLADDSDITPRQPAS